MGSATEIANGGELQLQNRLSESRSPYVSLLGIAQRLLECTNLLTVIRLVGTGAHGQSGGMADVDSRDFGPGEEIQSPSLCQHRLRSVSLYAFPMP